MRDSHGQQIVFAVFEKTKNPNRPFLRGLYAKEKAAKYIVKALSNKTFFKQLYYEPWVVEEFKC